MVLAKGQSEIGALVGFRAGWPVSIHSFMPGWSACPTNVTRPIQKQLTPRSVGGHHLCQKSDKLPIDSLWRLGFNKLVYDRRREKDIQNLGLKISFFRDKEIEAENGKNKRIKVQVYFKIK